MAERDHLIELEGQYKSSPLISNRRLEQRKPLGVPISSKPPSWIKFIATIILLLGIFAFLILLVVKPIYLRQPGHLSNAEHLGYITGVTALATLISSHTEGQIRKMWVRIYAVNVEDAREPRQKPMVRRARAVVGLSSTRDRARTLKIFASFLFIGLITTSIVSGMTPTTVPSEFLCFADRNGLYNRPLVIGLANAFLSPTHTWSIFGQCLITNSSEGANEWFTWTLADGSFIAVNGSGDPWCETQLVLARMAASNLDTGLGSGAKYTIEGAAVKDTAVGAPCDSSFLQVASNTPSALPAQRWQIPKTFSGQRSAFRQLPRILCNVSGLVRSRSEQMHSRLTQPTAPRPRLFSL